MKLLKNILNTIFDRMNVVRYPINRNDRYGMLYRAWGYIFTNLIEGAYYEFGLYQGQAFVDSWRINQLYRQWARYQALSDEQWRREAINKFVDYQHLFLGFDSFEGIPENNEGNLFFRQGTYAIPENFVRSRCEKARMKYQLIKGFFADVPSDVVVSMPKAAIVNIDCDLYRSTVDVLRLVGPKLQQGTIILMDDYNCFNADNAQGERRALREFCAQNPHITFEPWWPYQHVGQSFIVHLNNKKS
jgi:hypothetical protein